MKKQTGIQSIAFKMSEKYVFGVSETVPFFGKALIVCSKQEHEENGIETSMMILHNLFVKLGLLVEDTFLFQSSDQISPKIKQFSIDDRFDLFVYCMFCIEQNSCLDWYRHFQSSEKLKSSVKIIFTRNMGSNNFDNALSDMKLSNTVIINWPNLHDHSVAAALSSTWLANSECSLLDIIDKTNAKLRASDLDSHRTSNQLSVINAECFDIKDAVIFKPHFDNDYLRWLQSATVFLSKDPNCSLLLFLPTIAQKTFSGGVVSLDSIVNITEDNFDSIKSANAVLELYDEELTLLEKILRGNVFVPSVFGVRYALKLCEKNQSYYYTRQRWEQTLLLSVQTVVDLHMKNEICPLSAIKLYDTFVSVVNNASVAFAESQKTTSSQFTQELVSFLLAVLNHSVVVNIVNDMKSEKWYIDMTTKYIAICEHALEISNQSEVVLQCTDCEGIVTIERDMIPAAVYSGESLSIDGKKLKHGKGILREHNGATYNGDWVNDTKHGFGFYHSIESDSGHYIGEWRRNKMHGHGRLTHQNGDKYVGYWENNAAHGHGTLTKANGYRYIGNFVDGLKNGKGTEFYANGDKYTGDFVNDECHGPGRYSFADGRYVEADNFSHNTVCGYGTKRDQLGFYTGHFMKNVRCGAGVQQYDNGDVYVGDFVDNCPHGMGKLTRENGELYEGNWINGAAYGYNTTILKPDIGLYVGNVVNGVMQGYGVFYFINGDVYSGYFENNVFHGEGKLTKSDGSVVDGVWINGEIQVD